MSTLCSVLIYRKRERQKWIYKSKANIIKKSIIVNINDKICTIKINQAKNMPFSAYTFLLILEIAIIENTMEAIKSKKDKIDNIDNIGNIGNIGNIRNKGINENKKLKPPANKA